MQVYINWLSKINISKTVCLNHELHQVRRSEIQSLLKKYNLFQHSMHKTIKISLTWSKYMILVLLLISEGSWLLLPDRGRKPLWNWRRARRCPAARRSSSSRRGSSHKTTRHLPSRTMGSVSFWAKPSSHMTARQNKRATQSTNALLKRVTDTMMNDLQCSQNPTALWVPSLRVCSVFVLVYAKHPSRHQLLIHNHQTRVGGCTKLMSMSFFDCLTYFRVIPIVLNSGGSVRRVLESCSFQ